MALTFASASARVLAPATSANLGPGFDALGLALALHDEVTAEVTAGGVRVEVSGEGAGELPGDERHLVVQAMLAAFDQLGGRPPGLSLRCLNRIPQARGMGSSSAAIVAGVLLARQLVRGGRELLDDDAVLRLAASMEGHPDNVAPCLLGGFTIAWTEEGGARAVSLRPSAELAPVVYVPQERGLTAHARAALPATVPHADAALSAGRAALLVHAVTRAPDLLFPATEDRLHQAYRASGAPATFALVQALREAGVPAVVSGAGPTVLAFSAPPDGFDVGQEWAARRVGVEVRGAVVRGGTLEHAERDLLPQVG